MTWNPHTDATTVRADFNQYRADQYRAAEADAPAEDEYRVVPDLADIDFPATHEPPVAGPQMTADEWAAHKDEISVTFWQRVLDQHENGMPW